MSNEQTAIRLPLWAELPHLSLHLNQLLDITNMYLEPIIGDAITKTMMHNYFKAGIIIPPVKKRYSQKHVAGAIVVGLLKNVFTLDEIKQALVWILSDANAQQGYDNFVKMFNEQAAKPQLEPASVNSIDLGQASQSTVLQYEAVQSILYWLAAKNRLAAAMKAKSKA